MGGSGSAPQPPSPTESAQAQASAQLAGQMFEAANEPTIAYEDALVRSILTPYETQQNAASAAQSAYQSDPQAYEGRQQNLAATGARLGHLYGTSPASFTPGNLGVSYPDMSSLPSLSYINRLSKAIGSTLSSVHVDKYGNVNLISNQGSNTNLNPVV